MERIGEVIAYIEHWAPLSLQAEFDNCGLKFGDISKEITGIMITLDTNSAVVEEAIANNCNLIIEHHPSIFRPVKFLDQKLPLAQAMIMALKNDIALYSCHTNVDFCPGGLNDYVATAMGLKNIYSENPMSARIGTFDEEITLYELANKIGTIFNDKGVKTIGNLNKKIKKAAVINGGGGSSEKSVIDAFLQGADVLITGDIKYSVARLSKDANYAIIDFGHFESELCFTKLMKQKITSSFSNIKVLEAQSLLNPYNK